MYTVYKLLIDNKHFYIGCTKDTKQRHSCHMSHLRNNKHNNKHIQQLFNENNNISIDMCILKEFDNKKEAYAYETKTINEIGDHPLCLNIHSTSEQFTKSKEFSKIFTEEIKRKISENITGQKNPNWGKPHSDEHKRKIAEANKRPVQCPHCGKIGAIGIMGRWHFNNCKLKTNIQS